MSKLSAFLKSPPPSSSSSSTTATTATATETATETSSLNAGSTGISVKDRMNKFGGHSSSSSSSSSSTTTKAQQRTRKSTGTSKSSVLLRWCQDAINDKKPYSAAGVDVANFTTSWKDGLAFCAIIHTHRSGLIDWASLKKNSDSTDDHRENLATAFGVAQKKLGVEPLLDPEDLTDFARPDSRSIITYILCLKKGLISGRSIGSGSIHSQARLAKRKATITKKTKKANTTTAATAKPTAVTEAPSAKAKAAKSGGLGAFLNKSTSKPSGTTAAPTETVPQQRKLSENPYITGTTSADTADRVQSMTNLANVVGTSHISVELSGEEGGSAPSIRHSAKQSSGGIRLVIIQSGWLLKQGQHMKSLKNRYFVLTARSIEWFKTVQDSEEEAGSSLGKIRVSEIVKISTSTNSEETVEKQFEVTVTSRDRVLHLYAGSSEEASNWIDAFVTAVENRGGKTLRLTNRTNDFLVQPLVQADFDIYSTRKDTGTSTAMTLVQPGFGELADEDTLSPHLAKVKELTNSLNLELKIMQFKVDQLQAELDRVGIDDEDGAIRVTSAMTRTMEKAKSLQAKLVKETKDHSAFMGKMRGEAVKRWAEKGGTPSGYLRKPDFKKCDLLTWQKKRGDVKYQKRWFILMDGGEGGEGEEGPSLVYYKENPARTSKKQKPRGTLDLKGISQVRLSKAPKAPPHSLDIASDTHVYTLVASSKEEAIAWAFVIAKAANIDQAGAMASIRN